MTLVTGASSTKRSLGQRLAAYFALLAIAVQCFIVQPHVDPIALAAPRAAAIAASDVVFASIATASIDKANHAATGCVICQTALSGGHGIAPSVPGADTEQASLFISAPLPEQAHLSATPSHAWQSRGPPQLI
ncbi:MAG: hypothetical protein NT015_14760 [Alphaproteobacteria bacterium]|nr:hypothetical protein [Alphaproteobacteria bacterium]